MRSRICQIGVALAAGVIAVGLGAAPAQAAPDRSNAPSFKEFKQQTFRDSDGQFIVNGDEPVSKRQLKDYYKAMQWGVSPLIVNSRGGFADAWTSAQANSLTYCVSTRFGRNYSAVVTAMAQGAALWESAANVDFVYVPSSDSNCRTSNNAVLFSVEPTNTSQYIARAFFPSTPDSGRNILVNATSLQNSGSWTPGNIIGHELGHTLGFRHEHTRPESGTCFEDNNWIPLTPYDSVSIMHYPQCNGGSANLTFSPNDAAGAAYLYGG
jgi:Metallo-peptidase family M12